MATSVVVVVVQLGMISLSAVIMSGL